MAHNALANPLLTQLIKNPQSAHNLGVLVCSKQRLLNAGLLNPEQKRYVAAEAAAALIVVKKVSFFAKIGAGIKGLFVTKAVAAPLVIVKTGTAAKASAALIVATQAAVAPVAATTAGSVAPVVLTTTAGVSTGPIVLGIAAAGTVAWSGYKLWSLCSEAGKQKAADIAAEQALVLAKDAEKRAFEELVELLKSRGMSREGAYEDACRIRAEYLESQEKAKNGIYGFMHNAPINNQMQIWTPIQSMHADHSNIVPVKSDKGCQLLVPEKFPDINSHKPVVANLPDVSSPTPVDAQIPSVGCEYPAKSLTSLITLVKGSAGILDKSRIQNTPEDLAEAMKGIKKDYEWDNQEKAFKLKDHGKPIQEGVVYISPDYLHGELEAFDKKGKHLGAIDPRTRNFYKPPVQDREL